MIRGISAFLRDLFGSFISDVPAECARCEFICDKLDCPPELFDNCNKRIQYQDWLRDN